jgi:hypothetical protein
MKFLINIPPPVSEYVLDAIEDLDSALEAIHDADVGEPQDVASIIMCKVCAERDFTFIPTAIAMLEELQMNVTVTGVHREIITAIMILTDIASIE